MHIRIISECFEKYKCPGVTFFLQSSRYVSNEQLYFKTTGLYDYFYFYLVCFTFSISFSLCFPISPSLFFFDVISQAFIKCSRKAFVQIYAAAKSLQSCPTLCDPRDGSPLGSPVPGILQARTWEWLAISFSNA